MSDRNGVGGDDPKVAGRRARAPYSVQRQQVILRTLRRDGRVDATDVADELAVTTETIRKDLIRMEKRGLLSRVHGGAVSIGDLVYESDVTTRTAFADEKRRIATAALVHLPAAGSVLIDAGSTTAQLAELFPDDRELTVFTNALPIAMALIARPHLTVYPIGGRLRRQTVATVGSWTSRLLEEINVDVAFLGTNSISIDRGLTTPDPAEAQIKTLMVKAAQRRILLADHSKYGRLSLVKYAELSDIDLFITDTGLPAAEVAKLKRAGLIVEQT